MGIQELASGRKDLYMMDPEKLVEDKGWNVRETGAELDAHIRMLADSIKERGVLEPLTIWLDGDVPKVTNGQCRLLAVRLAKKEGADIKTVPVRVEERYASEGDRILSLITRNSGKPLSSLETAEVVRRLAAYGWDQKEIAKKTGYSIGQIGNFMTLAGLGPELAKPIKDGEISATLVVQEIRDKGVEKAKESVSKAIKESKAEGKKKVTRRDIPVEKKPRKETEHKPETSWDKWGPLFLKALKGLVYAPANSWKERISDAKEMIKKYEEGHK